MFNKLESDFKQCQDGNWYNFAKISNVTLHNGVGPKETMTFHISYFDVGVGSVGWGADQNNKNIIIGIV